MLPDDWIDWESDKELVQDRFREDFCHAGWRGQNRMIMQYPI
jgi:hypothetical protein